MVVKIKILCTLQAYHPTNYFLESLAKLISSGEVADVSDISTCSESSRLLCSTPYHVTLFSIIEQGGSYRQGTR